MALKYSRQWLHKYVTESRKFSTTLILPGNFRSADFVYDNYRGGSETLINRFVKHLAIERAKQRDIIPNSIKYVQFYPIHNFGLFKRTLRATPSSQLSKLMSFTYTYKNNAEVNKFVDVINEIDDECTQRISSLEKKEIFQILYGFIFVLPNRITQTQFFKVSTIKLVENLSDGVDKNDFIELCFYLGLWKKNPAGRKMLTQLLDKYFEHFIDELSTIDFAILTNSAFKTSTRIDYLGFEDRMLKELEVLKDSNVPLLVNFIKSVRHNKVGCSKIRTIMCELVSRPSFINKLDFRGVAHIFAYFADNSYTNEQINKILIDRSLKMMKNEFNFEDKLNLNIRPKDISTFIWSTGFLGLEKFIDDNQYKMITKIINHYFENQYYKYASDELTETVLYLWIQGQRHPEYLPYIQRNQIHKQHQDREKLDSKIMLLFTAAEIETPDVFKSKSGENIFTESRTPPDYLIKPRVQLQNVHKAVQNISDFKKVRFVAQIKNLNIVGIVVECVETSEIYHIEVCDAQNTLQDGTPNGIFKLKLRLLKHLGCNVIIVPASLTNEMEIISFIEDEIKRDKDEQDVDAREN